MMCHNHEPESRPRWWSLRTVSSCPLLLALMPKIGCPLCWPVLGALLGAAGLPLSLIDPACLWLSTLLFVAACVCWLFLPAHRTTWSLLAGSSLATVVYRVAAPGQGALVFAASAGIFVFGGLLLLRFVKSSASPNHISTNKLDPSTGAY
jgi:hypothetical protein